MSITKIFLVGILIAIGLLLSLGLNGTIAHSFLPLASTVPETATTSISPLVAIAQASALGLVQGITEFLPISSTAHLLIVTKAFRWELLGQKYFVDAIQFGSVIAVVIYFWKDLQQISRGAWRAFQEKAWDREEWKIAVGIAVGTVPALSVGYLLKDVLPESPLVIALASIAMSLLLGLAEKVGSRKRSFDSLSIQDGILVGLGQTLALVPGVSRSGSTLTTALFLGLERQTAARFSFLLGLPTLAIATLYQSRKAFSDTETLIPLLIGIISTFIFSYLSIAWLLKFLQTKDTWVFVWYRLGFGLMILLGLATGFFR